MDKTVMNGKEICELYQPLVEKRLRQLNTKAFNSASIIVFSGESTGSSKSDKLLRCLSWNDDQIAHYIQNIFRIQNEDKKITLESRVQKGLFCLKITNPVGGDANEIKYHASKINLTTRDGSAPATTKPDKASHGLGLKSMREIVLRYQGEMELKSENGTAELFLYMPLCGE